MKTLRFATIWDVSLARESKKERKVADAKNASGRFLTIWDNLRSSGAKAAMNQRTSIKQPKLGS